MTDLSKASKTDNPGLQPIGAPADPEAVRTEMGRLAHRELFSTGDYKAYLLLASDAPQTMHELYRLREKTFRAVGEGTGLSLDTDRFDQYYRHLILWNIPAGEIVGAYRIGYGDDIIANHGGMDGLYSSTLIKFGSKAREMMERSMLLGRSFIREEYQREVLPLKLMLTGICIAAAKDPRIRYCVGMVSISDALPQQYKNLIVGFLKRDMLLPGREQIALPSHPFTGELDDKGAEALANVAPGDIDGCNIALQALSGGEHRIPVLVRKYFSCGAKVICFNVDPLFSNSLDAMIVLDLSVFPQISTRSFVRALPHETRDAVFMHFYGIPYPEK